MSVINQMLQDLERRRGASVTESPLGGLIASGNVSRSGQPVNYILLGAVIVLAVLAAFLFGTQRSDFSFQETTQPQLTMSPKIDDVRSVKEGVKEDVTQVVVASGPDSLQSVTTQVASNKIIEAIVPVAVLSPGEVSKAVNSPAVPASDADKTQSSTSVKAAQTVAVKQQIPQLDVTEKVEPVAEEETPLAETITPVVMNKRIRPLTQSQQAQQYFQKAVLHLGRGEQNQAHNNLDKALSVDPSHGRARETLAALLLNTGRISEASAQLRDGLQLNPNAAGLAKLYARILVNQGDVEQSITVLERARPLVSKDPEYHALLAAFYSRVGKHGQAARVYQQVLRIRPGVSQWWMGLGLSFESMGEPAQALLSYQRAQRVGGLTAEVNKYVSGRIQTLSPSGSVQASSADLFEE